VINIRARTLMLLLGATACSAALQPDGGSLHGTVVLSRALGDESSPIVGTFRSVVDSLAISVGASQPLLGHHFELNETSVSIPTSLPAGAATLTAEVLSKNRTTLFSGSASAIVDHEGFSISLPLQPLTPVLVVFPDTVKIDSSSALFRYGSVTVHNSGKDSLSWSVVRDTTNTASVCSSGCSVLPLSGKLGANGDRKLVFTVRRIIVGGSYLPAGTLNYFFTSKEGTITLQWHYPAGSS
jgi:hypothetical protein